MGHEKHQPTIPTKEEEKPKDIHVGNFNFGQIASGGQAAGHVQGSQRWGQHPPEDFGMHSEFSFNTAAYSNVPQPYHPPAFPYCGGGGYPLPHHHPHGLVPRIQEEVMAAAKTAAVAAAAAEAGQKPPSKSEGEPKKPVAVLPADPPPPAAATCQQPPRKEPPLAHGYPGWDAAAGYSVPQYGYPPRHDGGYYDGGGSGYPVQDYPTHHGYGHGHGHGGGYGYYGYGAPPQHMGMGRLAAGAAAVHEAYHRYRQHGRLQGGGGYGHYQQGGYGGYGHHQGGYGGYGHHGKFKQGHHGKYSHYYGPHRGGKFGVN